MTADMPTLRSLYRTWEEDGHAEDAASLARSVPGLLDEIEQLQDNSCSEEHEDVVGTLIEAAIDALPTPWRRELVRSEIETVVRTVAPLIHSDALGQPTVAQLEWHVDHLAEMQRRFAEVNALASEQDARSRELSALLARVQPLLADDAPGTTGAALAADIRAALAGECPCCGETYTPAEDEIAMQCACENENCDENCPHVGHLYGTEVSVPLPDSPEADA